MKQELINELSRKFGISKKNAKEIIEFIESYNLTHKCRGYCYVSIENSAKKIVKRTTGKIHTRRNSSIKSRSSSQEISSRAKRKGGRTGSGGPGVITMEDD